MRSNKEEKRNERIGIIISVTAHALFLIFFLFMTAWNEPFPPNPGIPGVELALGFDDVGSGDMNTKTPVNDNNSEEETKPDEPETSEPTPEPTPEAETVESTPEANTVTEKGADVNSSPVDSPHKVPEKSKTSSQPKESTKVNKPKPNTETKEEGKDGAKGVSGENLMPAGSSSGNKENEKGKMGSPEGTPDKQNLYGNAGGGGGGGGGPELDIDGWEWDDRPDKKDSSNESGKIVFEIRVDDQGYIKSSIVKEANVSPSVVQFYKQQVDRLTFTRVSSVKAPPVTVGRITIIVKSR